MQKESKEFAKKIAKERLNKARNERLDFLWNDFLGAVEKVINMLESKTEVDNESIYDLLYSLYLHMALMQSEEDFKNGNFLTIDESIELMRKENAGFYI